MNKKALVAMMWTLLQAGMAQAATPGETSLISGNEWTAAAAVLVVSFAIALWIGLAVDIFLRGAAKPGKPGVDAYIDQMLAANGTHLRRWQ